MKQFKSYQLVRCLQLLKLFLPVIFFHIFSLPVNSQDLYISNKQATSRIEDNFTNTFGYNSKKRFWRAAETWTMMQVLPWAYNRFVRQASFAKISIKSITENFTPGNLEWDDNRFLNNQFSHPVHGCLYFNAFRSNGYDFWQSIPAVLAGSIVWETVGETNHAAPNDLINTTIGGIVLGEMSHRIARKLFDKKKAVASAEDIPASFVVETGIRYNSIRENNKFDNEKKQRFTSLTIQYGDPFTNYKKPFSTFSMKVEVGNDDSAKINKLQVEGILFGKRIQQTKDLVRSFNISLNYDFFQNSTFVYGAQSVKLNFFSLHTISKNIKVQFRVGAGLTMLAAIHDPHMCYGEGRNYDYGTGGSLNAGIGINISNRLFYNFEGNVAGLKTIDGYQSSHILKNYSSALRLVVIKNLSIHASLENYNSNGYYKNYPDISQHALFHHLALGYKFTF
jgi:hypothetical protein